MTTSPRDSYPHERPLAFDPYAAPARRSPLPVTLILSLMILGGIGGGAFWLYRGGLRAPGGPPEPVGAPVTDVRVAAPPQAQAPDPAAGLTIYKTDPNAVPGAPAFAPPPEQPTPRPGTPVTAQMAPATPTPAAPAPAVVAKATPAPPPAGFVLEAPTPEAPATPAPRHAKTPTIDTLLADATPTPKPKARHVAEAAPSEADAAADSKPASKPESKHAAVGGYVVQIGAFSSQAMAEKSWNSAAGVAPGSMAGKGKKVAQVTKPGGATLYRASITGFDTREAAQAMCARLAAAGRTCFVR